MKKWVSQAIITAAGSLYLQRSREREEVMSVAAGQLEGGGTQNQHTEWIT